MFGIGMPELMLIFVLALLVFGPKELPKIARTIGKAMAELRRASDELRDGIQREIEIAERDEAPSSPPEAVPSITPTEATPPAPETQPGEPTADGRADDSGTPAETLPAQVSTDPITLAPEEQTHQAETLSHAPAQPIETRNA